MKKVVNSVLASALALTVAPMVVGAEEATQAPQMDPGLQKTVKRLSALGLIQGYGNGDYGTDRSITRAEFATLVVRARGLEEGAKLAQFQSNFTDVKPSDWFSGYVNVASGQEIVKGYTDQTFKAGNNVTYAEAVAMVIRSLGYDPAVKGVWPNNYIAKASELGISKGITVSPDKPATRGDVFIMLDNSLNVGLMKQVEYGTDVRFEIYDGKNGNEKKTLLSEYLNVDVYDQDWANKNGNNSNDLPFVNNVPVMGLGSLKANEVSFTGSALKGTYKVADGINVNGYVGQHVQVWVKDDREDYVVWMENSDDEDVLSLRTDTLYVKDKVVSDGSKLDADSLEDLEIKFDNDKTYSLATDDKGNVDVKVVYNFKTYNKPLEGLKLITNAVGDAVSAKVVLNSDGDISYINVYDDITADQNQAGVKYGSEVVEKVDATKQKITNLEDGSFDLKDKEEGKDFLVYINGELKKLADLQPMDVYSVYYPEGNKNKYIVMATRTVVEGKVDKVESRKDTDNRLVIGDKTYRVRAGVSYSDNANKDIKKPTGTDLRDKLRDLDGVEVKIYLDAAGRIRHLETKDNVNDRRFKAVITKDVIYDTSSDKYTFVAYTEKGTKQTVSLEAEDIEWDSNGEELTDDEIMNTLKTIDSGKHADKLQLVEITLNSKGDVDKVKVLDDATINTFPSGKDWDEAADEDGNVLNVKDANGKKHSYDVTDSTVVFDMTGDVKVSGSKRNELEDVRLAKFKSVADDDDKTVYYTTDEDEVEFVFVVDGGSVSDNNEYGYVKNLYVQGGDDVVEILTRENGELKSNVYKLDGSVKDAQKRFNRFDFIEYGLNGDDEVIIKDAVKIVDGAGDTPGLVDVLKDVKSADLDDVRTGKVKKIDDKKITFTYLDEDGKEQTDTLFTSSSTAFFNTDFEDITSVNDGDYIVMVDTDDDESKLDYVIVVADEDEIDENEGDDEYNMDNFLAYPNGYEPPAPATDLVDVDKVDGSKRTAAGIQGYRVTGDAGAVDTDKVAKLELQLGSKKYEVTVKEDGSFDTGWKTPFTDVDTYSLIVTDNDGEATTVNNLDLEETN